MTQVGSGSGTPATAFTYDLTSSDAAIARRSEVRLLIGDVVDGAGPRPDGRNLNDAEIDYFTNREGNHIQRAAALALETLAAEWAKEASKQQLGPASSEARQSDTFAGRAAALRAAYGYTSPAVPSGSASGGFVGWGGLLDNLGL